MKIRGEVTLQLVAKKEEPSKDGTKMYKRLGVLSKDFEVGMLSCNEEIYKQVEVGKTYIFGTCYNDQYQSFTLESATPTGGK